jgi:hypothetical protein
LERSLSYSEQLLPRQFLTVMDKLWCGVAFAPSDEEIGNFLIARPVGPYPAPSWLEAEAVQVATSYQQEDAAEQQIGGMSKGERRYYCCGNTRYKACIACAFL